MGSIVFAPVMEVQRLIKVGLLTAGMNYRIEPDHTTLLAFCNRLEGRTLFASISHDLLRSPAEVYGMIITEEADGHEEEIVSVYRHGSLEHLVRTGQGILCLYDIDQKPIKKAAKAVVTVRVDEALRQEFDAAVEASGESQAVVLRQLMRYYIGKGPDPKMAG